MMTGGNMGRGNRRGGKKSPGKEKLQLSVCDVSSDEFKKTWLRLKDLHDKELKRLQTKLTSLRKERLAEGRRTGSTAKIKELIKQQKVLNSTINDLRDQLSAKVCERCSVSGTYRHTLQQEFYDMQQRNVCLIAELTAERNNLREENKRLSAKLKLNEQTQCKSSFNTKENSIPGPRETLPFCPGRMSIHGTPTLTPLILLLESDNDQPKSRVEKELQQSSELPIPLGSQDLFDMLETPSEVVEAPCKIPRTPLEVPETSVETGSSHSTKHTRENSANPKSSANLQLTSTLDPQRGSGLLLENSDSEEDIFGQPMRKYFLTQNTFAQKTVTQKCATPRTFSWSFSSSETENIPTYIMSETSEDNMSAKTTSLFSSFMERKEGSPSFGLFFDSTAKCGKRRWMVGAHCSPVFSVRGGTHQARPIEQSAVKKSSNESSSMGNRAKKPQVTCKVSHWAMESTEMPTYSSKEGGSSFPSSSQEKCFSDCVTEYP